MRIVHDGGLPVRVAVDNLLHREIRQRCGDQLLRPQTGDQATAAKAFSSGGFIREGSEKTIGPPLRLERSLDELRVVVNKRPGIADYRFEVLRIADEQGPELLGS